MTEHSESTSPANEAHPNWAWLQARIPAQATEQLGNWLSNELACLEERFTELVTADSRKRAVRSQLKRDRNSAD